MREKSISRIPWKKVFAATGLCLFFIGFVAVFGKLLPQGRKTTEDTESLTEKDSRKKRSKKGKNIGVQCALATAGVFILIVAAWVLWEKPWDKENEQTVILDLPENAQAFIPADELAGAAVVTEPQKPEEDTQNESTEDSQPEESSVTSEEDEAAEDEMTVLIETDEPLPQPQVTYVANETISTHRSAVAGDIVFVGDSRTVGMSTAVPAGDIYIAKVGAGYDWFSQTAIPEINETCVEGTILVINMGVNDLGNAVKYTSRINDCIEDWSARGIHVAYMSVNPVVDGHSNASNAKVERFNSLVSSALDGRIAWIDTYSSLVANGYATQDGLHYKNATYRQIYDLCISSLAVVFPPTAGADPSVSDNEAGEGDGSVSDNEAGEGQNPDATDPGVQDPNGNPADPTQDPNAAVQTPDAQVPDQNTTP